MSSSSNGGASPPLNLTTILAILTLLGGLFLTTRQLRTSRIAAPQSLPAPGIGDQQSEARLWQDPLQAVIDKTNALSNLPLLRAQIRARSGASNSSDVLLLPVLISGKPYGEDLENRIRTRFAVVSALGVSGYVPEDSAHLGVASVPWPTQDALQRLKILSDDLGWLQSAETPTPTPQGNPKETIPLKLPYEWFKSAAPNPSTNRPAPSNILVLWLDEDSVSDDPLTRLSLLAHLLDIPGKPARNSASEPHRPGTPIRIIGPQSSTTLHQMVASPPPSELSNAPASQGYFPRLLSEHLARTEIHSPSTTAADVALGFAEPSQHRARVQEALTRLGVGRSRFYSHTDDQRAEEVFLELQLRGVDLAHPKQHLVVISEWDTFYGQMLSHTYASEHLRRQNTNGNVHTYFQQLRDGSIPHASTYHPFVYLRGLDGRSAPSSPESKPPTGVLHSQRPQSFDEILRWSPDENRAEGEAQYDYLVRLGKRIGDLDRELRRRGESVAAVGIVGTDAYDTLLILQALRQRVSGAIFFTSELDARFAAPSEARWARNLVAISSYGLSLAPEFQKTIPPFRDSRQTATYAATLGALGIVPIPSVFDEPPRRFEIGDREAVDLSITPPNVLRAAWQALKPGRLIPSQPTGASNASASGSPRPTLHPLPPVSEPKLLKTQLLRAAAFITIVLCGYGILRRHIPWFRRVGFAGFAHPEEVLLYTTEDIGSEATAMEILRTAARVGSLRLGVPARDWLARHSSPPEPCAPSEFLVAQLNHLLRQTPSNKHLFPCRSRVLAGIVAMVRKQDPFETWWPMSLRRHALDEELDQLSKHLWDDTAKAGALQARHAAAEWFLIRAHGVVALWVALLIVGLAAIILIFLIRGEAIHSHAGEPYSWSNGISAWPAETIRFCIWALGIGFVTILFLKLRGSFFELSRKYRLPLSVDPRYRPPVSERACVVRLWTDYYDNGWFLPRAARAAKSSILYLVFGSAVIVLTGIPRSPTRGKLLSLDAPGPFAGVFLLTLAVTVFFFVRADWGRSNPRFGKQDEKWIPWPLIAMFWLVLLLTGIPRLMASGGTDLGPPSLDTLLLWAAISAFVFLTFLSIDAAQRCREFINEIAYRPTEYPAAARQHFSRLRAISQPQLIDEWIDVQLIADLTERLSVILWLPSTLFLLMLLSRSQWWDRWEWTSGLVVIMTTNFLLVILGILIVQHAARRAKAHAESVLAAKVREAQAKVAVSPAAHDASEAQKLLEEIQSLRRGAFVGFWENPVVGALLLPSGGTVLIEALLWTLGR